jgi:outer membrane protein
MSPQMPRRPHPNSRLSLLAALTVLLATPLAEAQSLKALHEMAQGHDATFLAARASAESARHRSAQAEALQRPSVGLQGSYTQSGSDTPLYDTRSNTAASVGVSATQSLYNRQNALTINKARKALDLAEADLSTAEQDLAIRLSQAYFDVLIAQDALSTARASKASIGEQLASAKRNFEVGTATITDTREAQARFDLATAQEIASDNDLRTKRLALEQLVGRTDVQPLGLKPAALLPEPGERIEAWVDKTEQSPTVRKARLAHEIARLETARTQAGHLPTVDLQGQIASTHNQGTGAVSYGGAGSSRNHSIGVTLKMPLYSGEAIQNQIREALALEERARNDLEAARRSVAQATRQLFLGVRSGSAQVRALEAAETSSRLALEATQLGYKVGVRVNLDVLNAQTQLYTTQRDLARSRYDVLLNSLRLRQAAGTLDASDIDAISALLDAPR